LGYILDQNLFFKENVVVVVFPQAPFRVTNVPGLASAGIIQLRNAPWLPLDVP
jgi:hypothetical protein